MADTAKEKNFDRFTAVRITDAYHRLGQLVDDCQRQPVILEKHHLPCAAIVSTEFLERALQALNGCREVMKMPSITDAQTADLEPARPDASELAADIWTDQPDTPAEPRRRPRLSLPFRS